MQRAPCLVALTTAVAVAVLVVAGPDVLRIEPMALGVIGVAANGVPIYGAQEGGGCALLIGSATGTHAPLTGVGTSSSWLLSSRFGAAGSRSSVPKEKDMDVQDPTSTRAKPLQVGPRPAERRLWKFSLFWPQF